MSDVYDLDEIRQGNTYRRTFRFTDGSSPVDLTGTAMLFFAELDDGTTTSKSTADAASGFAFTNDDPTTGSVDLVLTPAETRLLTVGRTKGYEIEWRHAGDETTLLAGRLIVSAGLNTDGD